MDVGKSNLLAVWELAQDWHRQREFLGWDADLDLAQATWEWPESWRAEPATCDPSDIAFTYWVNAR